MSEGKVLRVQAAICKENKVSNKRMKRDKPVKHVAVSKSALHAGAAL